MLYLSDHTNIKHCKKKCGAHRKRKQNHLIPTCRKNNNKPIFQLFAGLMSKLVKHVNVSETFCNSLCCHIQKRL